MGIDPPEASLYMVSPCALKAIRSTERMIVVAVAEHTVTWHVGVLAFDFQWCCDDACILTVGNV